jgi:enoyl-CoA hydratase/carnithine racemase
MLESIAMHNNQNQKTEWLTLRLERNGPIACVWLNRPDRRNALNQGMLEEIAEVFGLLQPEYDIRAVILGGLGLSFCAGADLKEPPGVARMAAESGVSARERRWFARLGPRALEAIERLDAVTIARIHGHAVGGGLLLALSCDLRIAAEGTFFSVPEVGLGDVFNWRGVPRLVREVGFARARQIVLLGERFDAACAERYGLLNRVVPPDQLDAAVFDLANRIAKSPETAVNTAKVQFRAYGATIPLGDASEFESNLQIEALRDPTNQNQFRAK